MPTERTPTFARRPLLAALATCCASPILPRPLAAQVETRFLRIGTGNVNGTYYRIGSLIADIVSNPPGSRPCDRGGSCGVPGLIAIAQSASGSVANVTAIQNGEVEAGFAQSDVAHGAFTGTGVFAGKPPFEKLRAIANLYPEGVHIVVRADAPIDKLSDLRGKRVSLDAEGSGTLVDARLVLTAFGLSERAIRPVYTPLGPSIDQMKEGELDAFFLVAGWPAPAVSELARDLGIKLLPVDGRPVDRLLAERPFFSRATIPADAYAGVGATPTIAVNAQWLATSELPTALVHGLLSALWHPNSRKRLSEGHPRGASIRPETALDGLVVPLHPGAELYYRERGLAP